MPKRALRHVSRFYILAGLILLAAAGCVHVPMESRQDGPTDDGRTDAGGASTFTDPGDASCQGCDAERTALRLTLSSEMDITSVASGVRPDSAQLGQMTYLGFTNHHDPAAPQSFGLLSLDRSLAQVASRTLAGPSSNADVVTTTVLTDLRLASDGQLTLWGAFETVPTQWPSTTCTNCLNFAAYRRESNGGGGALGLVKSGQIACFDWPCSQQPGPRPAGSVLPDDPVPFPYKDKFYILLRKQGVAVFPVTVFDSSFAQQTGFDLDLREVFGDPASLSVYSVLPIDGRLSLVTALSNGPPIETGSSSKLMLVPLSDDLKSAAGPPITLSQTADYQAYVSGARYVDGKLYVTHNIHSRQIGGTNKGVLKVFDARRGFALLEDIIINEGTPGNNNGHFLDDHLTVEVIGGKVYVFYPSPDDKLKVKVFEWR